MASMPRQVHSPPNPVVVDVDCEDAAKAVMAEPVDSMSGETEAVAASLEGDEKNTSKPLQNSDVPSQGQKHDVKSFQDLSNDERRDRIAMLRFLVDMFLKSLTRSFNFCLCM